MGVTYTENYNLKKPDIDEYVNIEDINGNMDIVDSTLKTLANTKEPKIIKNSGFNLDKSDLAISTSSDTLATSKAVKYAYDRGSRGIEIAEKVQSEQYMIKGKIIGSMTVITDLDDITVAGDYNSRKDLNKWNNSPLESSRSAFNLRVTTIQDNSAYVRQTITTYNSPVEFVRSKVSGTWSDWTETATSKAVKTVADLANTKEPKFSKNSGFNLNKSDSVTSSSSDTLATSRAVKTAYDNANLKLPLSGGTLTGTIKMIFPTVETEAGWARGISYLDSSDSSMVGGMGIYGNGTDNITRMFFDFGDDRPYYTYPKFSIEANGRLFAGGNEIYHEGNKPTTSEIGAEPAFSKKSGFNLDKSDSIASTSSDTLATSNAVKTAYDRGSRGIEIAEKVQSEQYMIKRKTIGSATVITDLDDIIVAGDYSSPVIANKWNNIPPGMSNAFNLRVTTIQDNSAYVRQTITDFASPVEFVRSKVSGTWRDWTEIATTAFVKNGFTGSFSTNGWRKTADGFIMQWGEVEYSTSGTKTVTLPIAFPNAILNVQGSPLEVYDIIDDNVSITASKNGTSLTTILAMVDKGSGVDGIGCSWFAIGY